MKFLTTASLPSFSLGTKRPSYIHFADVAFDLSIPLTSPQTVGVWICDGQEVTASLLDRWLSQAVNVPKSILVRDASAIPRLEELAKGRVAAISAFPAEVPSATPREKDEAILRAAEKLYAQAHANATAERSKVKPTIKNKEKPSVVLVGAGIMNLLTGKLLAEKGFQVRIVDQAPDPRATQPQDWTALGVTSGGHNARMFTYTEADNYNEQDSELYADMQSIFRKTVREGGWSVKEPKAFTPAEHDWVGAFERVPGWMAAMFKKEIHSVNTEAGRLWKELIKTAPELFEESGFRKDIVRLYVESVALEASVGLNGNLGSLLQTPSTEEFLTSYPVFRSAVETDHLAGGLIVDGFTVNVHLFVEKLIARITSLGGEFIWNSEVQGIQRNAQGEVTALKTQRGADLQADHFVISPGTSGHSLLHGTASENLVQGVLGIWLQIPNVEPKVNHSMKIHRRGHKVEDINVTVAKDQQTGEDILIFGGGYGYVGLDRRPDPESPELAALYDELEEVARIYFPRGYELAKSRGPTSFYPGGHRKLCVRPFTPTGLGLFETIPTSAGGQLIITGGNNTGGFAQAPAIAQAVLRSFRGEADPIQVLFHPARGKLPRSAVYKSRTPSPLASPSLSTDDLKSELVPQPQQQPPTPEPLKVLLVCSDSPNHTYLRYRLSEAFPGGYHCIVEPDAGQLRHLAKQKRHIDGAWQRYHGLRRKLLGHSARRAAHFASLIPTDYTPPTPDLIVDTVNSSPVWKAVEEWQPELTIVSGTKYIGKKLSDRAGLMINLHTGHLPEYKGNHCIFFALADGRLDCVASTLHQLTSTLDGGDVLDRVYPTIDPTTDNEDTLYTKCLQLSVERVVEHAKRFERGEELEFVPQRKRPAGAGPEKVYRHRDRTVGRELGVWWKVSVGGLLKGGN
ncbi:FAD dependent oxidoreductase-domain-containing protein [Chaetomium sp. MPI-SDFR-AT-0129]|nr:FAD dependent oxidoreductase-domain-containing protein [Chaetomium sp. MPI-SDFR-AT-0129]